MPLYAAKGKLSVSEVTATETKYLHLLVCLTKIDNFVYSPA